MTARSLKRRKGSKRPGSVLFIAVEGKTEYDYLTYIRGRLHIQSQRLIVHNVSNGPVSEIKRYLGTLSQNKHYRDLFPSIDYEWGVADTEWERAWKQCVARTQSVAQSDKRQRCWALSSASFERWLLLHFVDNPPICDARGLANAVSKYLPGYSHQHKGLNEQQLALLWERMPAALGRATRIRENGLDSDDGFTDVDVLVRQIMGMAN